MPKLPANLTYNDLNGREATEVLRDWFVQLLQSHPLMQPHLTIPMADFRIEVRIGVDMYMGGTVPIASAPDHVDINGSVQLSNLTADSGSRAVSPHDLSAVRANETALARERERQRVEHTDTALAGSVNAAPIAGGHPPDEIRDRHGLGIPRPGYSGREFGGHLTLADTIAATESKFAQSQPAQPNRPSPLIQRDGIVADGYQFSAEPVAGPVTKQSIPLPNGEIKVDFTGDGVERRGMSVAPLVHRASEKQQGDERGAEYGSVSGIMDPGPAGLMRHPGQHGRSRLSFGNNNR